MHIVHILLNTVLFATAIASIFLMAHAYLNKETILAKIIFIFLILIAIYTMGYLFEINSASLELMIFWNYVQYMAIPFISPLWLIMALTLIKKKPPSKRGVFLILTVPILIFFMRFTDSWHGLFYYDMVLNDTLLFPVMILIKGPFFYVQFVTILVMMAGANYLFINAYRHSDAQTKPLLKKLVFVSLLPWAAVIVNATPLGELGLDWVVIVFPIAMFALIGIIQQKQFLKLKPMVRNLVFEQSQQAMVVFDEDNRLSDYNIAARSMFEGIENHLYLKEKQIAEIYPINKHIRKAHNMEYYAYKNRYYQVHVTQTMDPLNRSMGKITAFVDMTEQVNTIKKLDENQKKISYLSYHDQLTGLYNRHYLESYLDAIKPTDHPMALIFVDMNNLKFVNDLHGHLKGDALIKTLATIISEETKPNDKAIRVGGDEFLLLMPQRNFKEAKHIQTRIQEKTKQHEHLSISIGYAIKYAQDAFEAVYKTAEDNMYRDKKTIKSTQS